MASIDLRGIFRGPTTPDLGAILDQGGRAFQGVSNLRRQSEADKAAQLKSVDTEDVLSELGTPGLSPERETELLGRIATLQGAPVANTIRQSIERGDKLELEELSKESTKANQIATFLGGIKDPAKRNTAIREEAQRASAKGEDVSKFLDLINMTPEKQAMAIERQRITSTDTGTLAKERLKQFELSQPKTAPGKLIADKQSVIDTFGEGSPQAKAFDEAVQAEDKPKLSDEKGIRTEFTKKSADFIKLQDALKKIQNAPETGAGDIALVFAYMKILDPQSTVREGEFATAANAGGVPEQVKLLWNKMTDEGTTFGEILTPRIREQFKSASSDLFSQQLGTHLQDEKEFARIAKESGIKPSKVIIDFVDPQFRKAAGEAPTKTLAVGQDTTIGGAKVKRIK